MYILIFLHVLDLPVLQYQLSAQTILLFPLAHLTELIFTPLHVLLHSVSESKILIYFIFPLIVFN